MTTGRQQVANRMPYIDCLRALACLAVIGQHTLILTPAPLVAGRAYGALEVIAGRGWLGVHLFLMLSGFCLYNGIIKRVAVEDATVEVKRFFTRRCTRMLPPYYVALGIFTAVAVATAIKHHIPISREFAGRFDIPAHLLMLHNLRPKIMFSIAGPFWSLALECQLYLLFPLFVGIAARRGLGVLAVSTLAVAVIYQALVCRLIGSHPTDWRLFMAAYYALPGRCFEFAIGMVAAALVARPIPNQNKIAAFLIVSLAVPAYLMTGDQLFYYPGRDQICGLLFACVAVLCTRIPIKVFSSKVLVLLENIGLVSYSIYLYHQPIIEALTPRRFRLLLSNDYTFLAFVVLRATLLVLVGAFMYRVWEKRWAEYRPGVKPDKKMVPN